MILGSDFVEMFVPWSISSMIAPVWYGICFQSIGNEIDYPNDPYTHEILNTGRNPQIYGKGHLTDHPAASRLGEISKQLVGIAKREDTTRPITAALAGVVMSNTTTKSNIIIPFFRFYF